MHAREDKEQDLFLLFYVNLFSRIMLNFKSLILSYVVSHEQSMMYIIIRALIKNFSCLELSMHQRLQLLGHSTRATGGPLQQRRTNVFSSC